MTTNAEIHGKPPSERTVRRYLDKFKAMPEEQRYLWHEFEWPAAMLKGCLPWEASAFCIALQMAMRREGKEPLTVLRMQWHWRLDQALPTLPFKERWHLVDLYAETQSVDKGPPNIFEFLTDFTFE